MSRDLFTNNVIQGLFRLWVAGSAMWLVIVAFLASRSLVPAAFLPLAVLPPLMLLMGAVATVWVVRGFKGQG